MKNLAIIPARGGSKRIPDKNVRLFNGRPIIAYSIDTALASQLFDRVVVSTDSERIAEVAREAGAEVPFLRAAELADDMTGTVPVIADAIAKLAASGYHADLVCCLYATAPMLSVDDLGRGLTLLQGHTDFRYAFSVAHFAFPVQRALHALPNGGMAMLYPEYAQTRSQDLEEVFHDAGQFYWGRPEAFLDHLPLFAPHSAPVFLPRHRVQDIDTLEDWTRAELMHKVLMC